MGRDLRVSHKTAYVLLHKIRESLLVGRDECALSGAVHVDGAYVGGKVRPENRKEDRVDRRLAENQDADKRCILVMRQVHGEAEVAAGNAGARKTLTFSQIHKMAPKYLDNYANEMAYREDARRWSNGDIFRDSFGKCARALVSRDWCGYWQGNHRQGESLAV